MPRISQFKRPTTGIVEMDFTQTRSQGPKLPAAWLSHRPTATIIIMEKTFRLGPSETVYSIKLNCENV